MDRASSADYLAQVTKFELFLILNKGKLMLASFVAAFLIIAAVMPSGSHRPGPHSVRMQTVRTIEVALFGYAQDHNGKYPIGKSSTDIFQQLVDQQYIYDPDTFYFPMSGKTKAKTNKLKAENVCYDVTNGVVPDDPDGLPVVFSTGYKINYVRGGKAQLLPNGDPDGIAVAFKSNSAAFLRAQPGGIPLFPPEFYPNPVTQFNPKGRIYVQLTPDGPLP